MRAAGAIVVICPRPPTVLGTRGSVRSFISAAALTAWSAARRALLAALRRARQRRDAWPA
jgi:hypothetical protein